MENKHFSYDVWLTGFFAEYAITAIVSQFSLTVRSCVCWMNELAKIDQLFCVYFSAVALLHIACKIAIDGISNKWLDILATVLDSSTNICHRNVSLRKPELNTPELVKLLHKLLLYFDSQFWYV